MPIWNPWHGCHKKSAGCLNCYMFRRDSEFDKDSNTVSKTNSFDMILKKKKDGTYKIQNEKDYIYTCMTSDFFIEEADLWRPDVFKMIKERKDLHFILLKKRIDIAFTNLHSYWEDGYNNVTFTVICEFQISFERRISDLLKLKAKSKTIMISPLLDEIDITKLLKDNKQIEYINCGGENGKGARPLYFDFAKKISEDSLKLGIPFYFFDTGTYVIKDNKKYYIPYEKRYTQAFLANISHN